VAHSLEFPGSLAVNQLAADIQNGERRDALVERYPVARGNIQHEDTEATLADLKQRVAKTLEFVRSVTPDQLRASEDRAIELKFPSRTLRFTGRTYLTDFVLPNFYFHECMVYALLRNNGVEIGKDDFLGAIQ
jgi:uncharacterized protein